MTFIKSIVSIAALSLSLSAFAGTTVTGEIGSQLSQPAGQRNVVSEVRIQADALGVQVSNNSFISRAEVDYNIPLIKYVSVAVGLGDVINGTTSHLTYSIEPILSVPVTDKIALSAAYKFRDATKSSLLDETRTATLQATYKLTDAIAINIKGEQVRGSYIQNVALAGVSYSF